jgi:hypothetical protein
MRSQDTRREENQKLFRLGNERLRGAVGEQVSGANRIPFLCECADESCNGRVELPIGEWEEIARKPRHYVMVSGHPRSEDEQVIGSMDGYDVVVKAR